MKIPSPTWNGVSILGLAAGAGFITLLVTSELLKMAGESLSPERHP